MLPGVALFFGVFLAVKDGVLGLEGGAVKGGQFHFEEVETGELVVGVVLGIGAKEGVGESCGIGTLASR